MTGTSPHPGPSASDRFDANAWAEHLRTLDPADLRLLVTSLPVIEQAKGIVMGHYGCDARTAFTILQRWSSIYGLKLRDVAGALVDEASHDAGPDEGQPTVAVERFLRAHGIG